MNEPTTLYDLLDEVCTMIQAQPLNYYQESWTTPARYVTSSEACGTAYCRAGWMAAVGMNKNVGEDDVVGYAYRLMQEAGFKNSEFIYLFGANQVCRVTSAPPGTAKYAEAGAAGVRAFMNKHEDRLRAAKLTKCEDDVLRIKEPVTHE